VSLDSAHGDEPNTAGGGFVRSVVYRIIRTSWGIYVRIEAEATLSPGRPPAGEHAAGRLWLDVGPTGLTPYSVGYLVAGMRMLESPIAERVGEQQVLVSLDAVDFSLADFQDEGLTAAMLLWLAAEFDLPAPDLEAHYVPDLGRYVFPWQRAGGRAV
jgi:hypothetical protein